MKDTIENKKRFVACYAGQRILTDDSQYEGPKKLDYTYYNVTEHLIDVDNDSWVLLTPLSQITDEDAIEVAKILNVENSKKWIIESFTENEWSHRTLDVVEAVDYLRSKGYAISFMGLSVEEQIKRGWVKLK